MTYSKFGEKPKAPETPSDERPAWEGPLDIERRCTDMPFFVVFALLITFWILIAAYVFTVGEVIEVHKSDVLIHEHLYYLSVYISAHFYDARYIILGFVTLSFLLLVALISLFRWATRFTVYVTLLLMLILLLLLYGLLSFCVNRGLLDYVMVAPLAIAAMIYVALMYAVLKVGVDVVCKVIAESCQAIFFFPSTLLFMFCQFVLHVLVAAFAMALYVYLSNNPEETDALNASSMNNGTDSSDMVRLKVLPYHAYIFEWVNVLGFVWANLFIMGLGRMVLTATFATWYHVEDKKSVPYTTVLRCFVQTVVYHTGSIAYVASFLWIFPMIYIVFKYGRDRLREMYKRPLLILSWLIVILKFPFDALSACAIHGDAFYESAKSSYILMMKNPMSFLVINTITECVIFIGSLLVPVLTLLLSTVYEMYICDWHYRDCSAAVFVATVASLLMSLTFFMVFRAASNTLRFCYLEESKFNDENDMNLYEMHVDEVPVRNDVLVY